MASESLERATIRFHSPNALVMTLYSAYHNLFLLFQLKKPSKLLARNVKQAEKQLTEAVFMFSGFADILWAAPRLLPSPASFRRLPRGSEQTGRPR